MKSPNHNAYVITASGTARSGKGTSVSHLKGKLEKAGQRVISIDQGIKFRAMAKAAAKAEVLDSPASLGDFLSSAKGRDTTLKVLAEVATMDKQSTTECLYTPEMSRASGKVGKVASAHEVAVGLLRSQVAGAIEAGTQGILIDGRSVDKYAREFAKKGLAKYAMGWHFSCDPAVAARRSLGIFEDIATLSAEDKERLLAEAFNISDRNRSDTTRAVDPLREPADAYHLNLLTYGSPDSDIPYKIGSDIVRQGGQVAVDTSYTSSVAEMTGPVTEVTQFSLVSLGLLDREHVGIEVATAY